MTAAELLSKAEPPADDALIEKAIADLDVKIWEWADALKSAHTQLRTAFAVRPAGRPSAALYDNVAGLPASAAQSAAPSAAAAAAAAHLPSPPPMPKEWTAPVAAPAAGWTPPPPPAAEPEQHDWAAAAQAPHRPSQFGGHGASSGPSNPAAQQTAWGQPADPASHTNQGASSNQGTMSWPSAPAAQSWPDSSSGGGAAGPQAWPTWTPTDTAAQETAKKKPGSNVRATKAPRATRPVVEGPTPEERAQKAAAEEAMLSELDDAIARRVRLLRRLDPDTSIEKLIEKAKQGQAEGAAAPQTAAKDDKSSSSWWRRK